MEIYRPWAEPNNLIGPFTRDTYRRDRTGLVVVLEEIGTSRFVEVRFRRPISFRAADESFRLRTWSRRGGASTEGLFLVEGSLWLQSVVEEAGGILDGVNLVHYAIYTQEDCLDIASKEEPHLCILPSAP
jgi:hypothetical protein